ncbi:hypothetical protein [Alloalcanivorax venustensis]|uniref:hypothetical protein n=1 Tax=Alloalcanivorax venustensis TaxID=172371 RepID=UPI0018915E81|nr:hypothetical protein [Alloalcanivorax venustensis]
MKQRKLKVRKGHWGYTLKSEPYGGNRIIPFVLLKGTWLKKPGLPSIHQYSYLLRMVDCLLFEIAANKSGARQ